MQPFYFTDKGNCSVVKLYEKRWLNPEIKLIHLKKIDSIITAA